MKIKRIISFLMVLCMFCTIVSAVNVVQLNTQLKSKYMILVNRDHKLSANYVPSDLVYYGNSGMQLEKACATALKEMIDACAQAGGEKLVLYSGYRSYQRQYDKYYGKINQYIAQGYSKEKATQLTDQYYAPPGGSEHHTGLAADICLPSIVNRYGQLHESFGETAQGKWLRNNCYKYGFILRYDKGKESLTGYNYEPWHFRYIGKEHAAQIYNLGLTYEEYLSMLNTVQSKLAHPPKIQISNNKITFTAATGTQIRYTTNNKTPTLSSTKYSSSLSGKNITYKAISCYAGYTSAVATVTVTKYGDIFTDITVGDWYYDIVSTAVYKDLFQGMGNYQFAPQKTMTRAMLVQVLANISGIDLTKYKGKSSYSDVKISTWYAPSIQWATENAVVQGLGDGRFAPTAAVTREQVCVIFYNHSGDKHSYTLPPFKDQTDVSSWAKKGVAYCAAKGIVNGYPDKTFLPQAGATRAEVAKIALTYLSA